MTSPPADPLLRRVARVVVPQPLRQLYWGMYARRERRRVLSGQFYEPAVAQALLRFVRPGWICADVGANTGLLTALLADRVGPRGHIYAFEPHPANAAHLRTHLSTWGLLERVTIVQAAVSDGAVSQVQLFPGRRHSGSEWNIVGHDSQGQSTAAELTIPAIALDHFHPAGGAPGMEPAAAPGALFQPQLLKIDVEGAESLVLQGMQHILRHSRPVLVIECHSPANWEACMKLAALGYTFTDTAGRSLAASSPMLSHLVAIPQSSGHI